MEIMGNSRGKANDCIRVTQVANEASIPSVLKCHYTASCCILAATLIANTNGHVIRFCGALDYLYFFTSSIRLTVSVAFFSMLLHE